jgi:hypothetical protein
MIKVLNSIANRAFVVIECSPIQKGQNLRESSGILIKYGYVLAVCLRQIAVNFGSTSVEASTCTGNTDDGTKR